MKNLYSEEELCEALQKKITSTPTWLCPVHWTQSEEDTEPLFVKPVGLRNDSRHMEGAGGAVGGACVEMGVGLRRGNFNESEEGEQQREGGREIKERVTSA